jgi:tight adherence protein B
MGMSIDAGFFFYGLLFLTAMFAAEGIMLLMGGRRADARVRKRLLNRKTDGTVAVEELRRRTRDGNALAGLIRSFPPLRWVDLKLVQAGSTMPTMRFIALLAIAWAVIFAALFLLRGEPVIKAAAVAAAMGIGAPLAVLRWRVRKRIAKFGRQLPEAVDLVVRSLRAGHPVNTALLLVAEQCPSPVREEFGLVVDEMTYGLDLTEALDRLSRRVELDDLKFMVAAIRIQHKAGGNLAEVLASLSKVNRARAHVLKKAKALSAEGRMSAWLMSGLPVFVVGVINLLNPEYYGTVSADPLFLPGMVFASLMGSTGAFVIWRMVNIRV